MDGFTNVVNWRMLPKTVCSLLLILFAFGPAKPADNKPEFQQIMKYLIFVFFRH
jgi:hypothetical protein